MNLAFQSIHFPVAEVLLAILFGCAAWLRIRPARIDRARFLVAAALIACIGVLVWTAWWLQAVGGNFTFEGLVYVGDGAAHTYLLGVDGLSATFGLTALAVALVAVFAAERARLSVRALEAITLTTAANLLIVFSRTLWLIAVGFWIVALLVPALNSRRGDRTGPDLMARVFLVLSALALSIATTVLAVSTGDAWGLVSHLNLELLTPQTRWIVLIPLLFAVIAREGIFPLHGWFVPLATRDASFGPAVTLLPHVGVYVVLRVIIPAFPGELPSALPILSGLAAASALLLALRATVQRSFGRAVALIVLSQSALILVGVETMNFEGIAGGLMALTASSVGGVTLLATTSFATARMGDPNLRGFMGLGASTPRLAAAFLVFGLAMVAFPGTVGFVGEDLLFHGAFESSIPAALAIILAAALNGYMVLYLFSKAFLGPGRRSAWMRDLMPLELVVVVLGLAFVVGLGLVPQPLLNLHAPRADQLSTSEVAAGLHQSQAEHGEAR